MAQHKEKKREWAGQDILSLLQQIDSGYSPNQKEQRVLRERQTLDLSGSGITALPASIARLTGLKTLILSGCNIQSLPDSVGRLTHLQSLFLNCSKISSLPSSIGQLVDLRWLDLQTTNIEELPEEIGQLRKLQTLNLFGTALAVLPESITQLTELQALNLFHTKISTLPEQIGRLSQLKTLDVSKAPISVLPESIGELVSLQKLDCSQTQISALPDSVGKLTELQILDISGTAVTALPNSVRKLDKLRKLYISDTGIWSLPEALVQTALPIYNRSFGMGPGIYAEGSLLPEIYFAAKEALYRALQKGKPRGFEEAKVVFLGDGGVGKSSAVKRILHGGAKGSDDNPSVPDVWIADYTFEKKGNDFTVHLWDFNGQVILNSLYRCFLSDNTVYVVMVSTRSSEQNRRLGYWLHNISQYAPGAEVLIIVNIFEGGERADVDEILLMNEFRSELNLRFVTLSVKEASLEEFNRGVTEPLLRLAEKAEEDAGRYPPIYMTVKENISRRLLERQDLREKQGDLIIAAEYAQLCMEVGLTDSAEQAKLLRCLSSIGIFFCDIAPEDTTVPRNCRLSSPAWLCSALLTIILECKAIKGWVSRKDVYGILASKLGFGVEDCDYVLRIAERYALSYQDPENRDQFFFPAMNSYTGSMPINLGVPKEYAYCVEYEREYSYLFDTVVPRLMLYWLREGYDRSDYWLGGFSLKWKSLRGFVNTTEDDRGLRITLWSTSETAPVFEYLQWFRKRLDRTIDKNDKQRVKEYVYRDGERYSLPLLMNARDNDIRKVASEQYADRTYEIASLLGDWPDAQGMLSGKDTTIGVKPQEDELSWARFEAYNRNPLSQFGLLCKELFVRENFGTRSYYFRSPDYLKKYGITIPRKRATQGQFEGARVVFQTKYFFGEADYSEFLNSLKKMLRNYRHDDLDVGPIDIYLLYSNQLISINGESEGFRRSEFLREITNRLHSAGIQFELCAGADLLQRIENHPDLVQRFFSEREKRTGGRNSL